jgi:predicted dehydrogenase
MQQVLQNLGNGEVKVVTVPSPQVSAGRVLIRTRCTLISSGTERMLVEFGKANWLGKAKQQPEKVRQVLSKIATDGFLTTFEAVQSKLNQPLALGYCHAGVVENIGENVSAFRPGDRIVSNAAHAESVVAPVNLCARIPVGVSDEAAVFTVPAAIGLQAIRLAAPTLGECFVVTGLGLIGLLTVQLLRAHGCRVLGIDISPARAALARQFGAEAAVSSSEEDLVAIAADFSRGRGVDGVILTASTASSEPVAQAAKMCRKRGRIVLVGVAGLNLARQDFYEKELTFQVSCSYGPGRYDAAYEQMGQDYPVGFVRWTEQRNFEAVLDMMASGMLDVTPLITHRFSIESAQEAYAMLTSGGPSLGIVLHYPPSADIHSKTIDLENARTAAASGGPVVGCVGAGNYGGRILIPALVQTKARLHTIVATNGLSAAHYGRKFGFARASTSATELFTQKNDVNTLVIATRHDSHAQMAAEALRTGRHVYVEKPLAVSREQLAEVERAFGESRDRVPAPILMVGFNRRFSPHTQRMRRLLQSVAAPKALNMLMNAGAIPRDHWTQDPVAGGGRILGEACHSIDLARFLIGRPIIRASGIPMRTGSSGAVRPDTASISLEFEDGSVAAIQYYANGHRDFPKERVEAFCDGRILTLDNFRVLRAHGWAGARTYRTWRQEKGHAACIKAFIDAVDTGDSAPIPPEEIFEVSKVAIEIAEALA